MRHEVDSTSSATVCRLGYLWMYEAPGIFHALWRIVSPFVDHNTRAKIKFVYGAEGIKEFQEHIPQDVRV